MINTGFTRATSGYHLYLSRD